MELSIYALFCMVAIFFTYLAYSKNVDQTDINKFLAGLIWFALAFNTFVISYYISNGSVSSYTAITKNSEYWQILTALIYGFIGFSIWIQLALDRMKDKEDKISFM